MMDVTKLVENAELNFRDVTITEWEGGIKVYRKKVAYKNIPLFCKNLLLDALECLAGHENLKGEKLPYRADTVNGLLATLLGGHLTMMSTQDAQYIARAYDRVKTCYAVLAYIAGEEQVKNEFSNYLLK